MDPRRQSVIVTGAASGIGAALAQAFADAGARAVGLIDRDPTGLAQVAESISSRGVSTSTRVVDVTEEADLVHALQSLDDDLNGVSIMCSNAGVAYGGGVEAPDSAWDTSWSIHVMAHVWAARALIPRMAARGGGHLLTTASAAGLLTNLGAAPYAVTKHAAVALAEWMAISYRDQGIRVSCLCPQGVRTKMLFPDAPSSDTEAISQSAVLAAGEVMEPEEVAAFTIDAMREDRFLILPHPQVHRYLVAKAQDAQAWLDAMSRMNRRLASEER
jgi:NAD(P)-dependent dehydrogenase (short-subunit alcohol dehydrogenase family)